jgi:hypothetical protein
MKWTITLLAIVFTTIACKKTALDENISKAVASASEQDASVLGTWRLTEYFLDYGNGTGAWQQADSQNPESIVFSATGDFSASSNSPLFRFTSYKVQEDGMIGFFTSTGFADAFPYTLESATQLLIKPLCRENCMRRYQLIESSTK